MDLWYTEKQTPHVGITCMVRKTLYRTRTKYQDLAILDTFQFGRMLVLDGMVQTTIEDEFIYHEMISHVPMVTHPNPQRVLVIGGGDGGVIREIIKYPVLEHVTLVEIDGEVIEASRRYLPEISAGLDHHKVDIKVEDGVNYIARHQEGYDIVIVDSTEPVGPAVNLFTGDFYRKVYRALKKDGLLVAQTESPFFNRDLIRAVYRDISAIFPVTRLYLASIPTYPSGLWSFTLGSKVYDPLKVSVDRPGLPVQIRYYSAEVHRAAFTLPPFIAQLVEDKER